MRWRPTLAALAVLAVVGALAVAASSGSVPPARASLDESGGEPTPDPPGVRPVAATTEPDPTGGPEAPDEPGGEPTTDAPTAAATEPDPTGGPDTVATAGEEDLAEADPPPEEAGERDPPGEEDPGAADSPDATGGVEAPAPPSAVDPALGGTIPTICPDPSDPFFALYHASENCYWLRFEDEFHEGATEEELALIESVPFVPGYAAEPLGRPAREIRWGPRGEADAPRFYLTFDDGPSPRWTRPTLDLLDRYGARATFFPVGSHAALSFHLIEEIVARGHTIGSHLWSHEKAALTSEELFRRELRASAELYGELGTTCLRTPFGIINDDILEWAGDEGFEVVLWAEPDPRDWEFPGIEELTRRMLGMRNGSILILHEHTGADTLAALDAALAALSDAGWRFDEPICPLRF